MDSRVGHAGGDPLDILRHDISSPSILTEWACEKRQIRPLVHEPFLSVILAHGSAPSDSDSSIQYLLIGAGICLFYLLELSLAEHVGFFIAYAAASMCITLIVGLYTWSVLKSLPKAWTISGVLCGLYGLPICRAQSQDHALLIGSIGLVVALGSTMYLTRGMHRRHRAFRSNPQLECGFKDFSQSIQRVGNLPESESAIYWRSYSPLLVFSTP